MSSSNPFTAPAVEADVPAATRAEAPLPFEPVPSWKIWLLMPATAGLYAYWWVFQNFRRREDLGEPVWALPRGLFHLIFLHSLCWRVSQASIGLPGRNPALVTLATVYVGSWMGEIYVHNVMSGWGPVSAVWVALAFLAVRTVLVVVVQGEMNRVLEVAAPDHDRNHTVGPGLVVALVLSLGLWGLFLIGSVA